MTPVELLQKLHEELRVPGTPPAGVTGLTGFNRRMWNWIVEAYQDIQREEQGRWHFLHREFYVNVAGATQQVFPLACYDLYDSVRITDDDRFGEWDLMDKNLKPRIYKTDEGEASEWHLTPMPWRLFEQTFFVGQPQSSDNRGTPYCISVRPDTNRSFYLGPYTSESARVTGWYWRAPQVLALDDDILEMPSRFHMLIVYRAMLKYGYQNSANEVIARATSEGTPLFNALKSSQAYSQFTMQAADSLDNQ